VTLHAFENALASMTALIYWAGMNVHYGNCVGMLIQYRQEPTRGQIAGFNIGSMEQWLIQSYCHKVLLWSQALRCSSMYVSRSYSPAINNHKVLFILQINIFSVSRKFILCPKRGDGLLGV
jgi:hypothetical protein